MLRILALVLVIATTFAACSSEGDDPQAREAELRDAIDAAFTSFQDGDVDEFYESFSDDFHDRCEDDEFREVMTLVRVFISALDDVELRVEDVEFQDRDHATVNVFIEGEGNGEVLPNEDDDGFLDTWVREDGEWKTDINDDPKPCDLSFDSTEGDGDGDDEVTPVATGPGTSREEAVEIGETVRSGDLEVTVVSANLDAEEEVLALSDFNDAPRAGQRYALVRLRVRHAGEGSDTISVSSSDFKLTGSANVLYDGFGDSSCGFFDGDIGGEMFPGGELEGTVCFQIPEDESGMILVAQPFVSFEDSDRRFISLE